MTKEEPAAVATTIKQLNRFKKRDGGDYLLYVRNVEGRILNICAEHMDWFSTQLLDMVENPDNWSEQTVDQALAAALKFQKEEEENK